jgi:hypothetical protein
MVAGKVRKFASGNDGTSIRGALARTDPDKQEIDGSPSQSVCSGATGIQYTPSSANSSIQSCQRLASSSAACRNRKVSTSRCRG